MIVVIGGGYAGAATARALARRGAGGGVTLLEAEPDAARHASGRNAGLIGPLLEDDPVIADMAARGAARLRGTAGYDACGSVLLCDEAKAGVLCDRARAIGTSIEVMATADLARDIPLLESATSPVACRVPGDGRVDPAGLVDRYLSEAREGGVRILTGARAGALRLQGGSIAGVETSAGFLPARQVVNAAGAAAGTLATAQGGGLSDLALASYRRHLFDSEPLAVDPGWPWVWDLVHDVYFRVDADRLTLCPCDEDPHDPSPPAVDPAAGFDLARRLAAAMPAVARLRATPRHACLRTYVPDRRYVVGADPRLEGYFWVAGLGGSGATASAAVGDLAAGILLGEIDPDDPIRRAFDPARCLAPPPAA